MAAFKLHEPCCACWYCRFENNWFHYLPISFRIYNWIMQQVRFYLYERTLKMKTHRTHRTCDKCKNSKPYHNGEFPLLCTKTGIEITKEDCCGDFIPKPCTNKLEAAAKKCAKTGSRYDLQQYLKLRREML